MALEAVTQTIEIDGVDFRDIRNYEFCEVILQAALIVPDDNHEMKFFLTLHSLNLINHSFHKFLYTFMISSVTQNNNKKNIIRHVRGRVNINFDSSEKF